MMMPRCGEIDIRYAPDRENGFRLGLMTDMGHGWCMESFGIDTTIGWFASDESTMPEESRQFIAEVGGQRKLWDGIALNTNFCMSNPEARRRFVKKVSDYAALATNVDYLHVWLADGYNNHCECAECQKMTPSDYYVKTMNELDAFTEDYLAHAYGEEWQTVRDMFLELGEALATKAEGKDREALKMVEALRVDFGKYELEMERCYDQRMCFGSLNKFFHNMTDNGAGVFYEG